MILDASLVNGKNTSVWWLLGKMPKDANDVLFFLAIPKSIYLLKKCKFLPNLISKMIITIFFFWGKI